MVTITRTAVSLILLFILISSPLLSFAEETEKNSNTENINELLEMLDFMGDTKKISVSVE